MKYSLKEISKAMDNCKTTTELKTIVNSINKDDYPLVDIYKIKEIFALRYYELFLHAILSKK